MDGLAADLTARGWLPCNLSYRRLGEGGGWPTTFEDVRAGVAAIAEEASDVVVIGHSAGGQLALWVAAHGTWPRETPPRLAVALGGVVDLAEAARLKLSRRVVVKLLGGKPDRVPERYRMASPIERLPLGVPTLLVHGARDDTVPVSMSEAYAAAARRAGDDVELVVPEREGHFEPIDPASASWAAVVARLARLARS
jgi:dipeptidyl aminopeptidase/acylaminoacyl peptidase